VSNTASVVRSYEQLRRGRGSATCNARGAGYWLVVQRGLAAWIEAWSRCRPASVDERESSARGPESDPGRRSSDVALPCVLYPSVIRQLAQMARGPLEEVLR
jgi:hypothetical protein